jgi:hypothetical protein
MAGAWPEDDGFGVPSCRCWNGGADYRLFTHFRDLGTDMTDGRYADVAVLECRECGLLWLRYSVEYEGFSKSGRWARGNIGRPEAEAITPELAVQHLETGSYMYGGSYFDGASGWRTGAMHWGL